MLRLENVSKIYYDEGVIATGFSKLNLELNLGEFVVITGESGSGKSTLLNVISGLDTYEEGEMYINGKETSHYTASDFEEYRKKYIANIFQNFNLVNSYTVYQNVELILLLNGYKKRHIKQKVLSIIEEVGLSKFKNTKVAKLSGGQKQRVAIARAIIKDTPIIVADEPTGNLDSKSAQEIIELLKKVAKDKLVVIVTHNLEQVEQYATRIIKMHDGRMIQNREIKKVKETLVEKEGKYFNIKMLNQYRLGIRNTFNIFSKFVLLFSVFFFMGAAFLAEYAGFQLMKDDNNQHTFSVGFNDLSDERILIKKQDKMPFTTEDYAKIKSLSNVDYIVEDDLFLDISNLLNRDDIGLQGNLLNIETLRGNIDLGRTIENNNELVLKISRKNFYITDRLNDVLNKTFSLINPIDNTSIMDLTIVGIQFMEDNREYENPKFYVSSEVLEHLRSLVNRSYSTVRVLVNNQYGNYSIAPNENVKQGYAIVNDELKYLYKNNRIKNEQVTITVKNIYYEETVNVKVSGTYAKSNFKKITGLENYESSRNTIFINPADYNLFYNKPSYQSSVFVKNCETIDETLSELETLGLNAKRITEYTTDVSVAANNHIIEITRVVVTITIIVVLFFLSYVMIRLIMKSRNVYYTTLRMLGATDKNVRKILKIELLLNASLAYITTLVFIYFIDTNVINIPFLQQLTSLLSIREYIVIYIILLVIVTLISRKFAKHVFKKSVISTYQEEV